MNDDLKQRCREVLDWQKTGLLHGGNGGRLRALADRLGKEQKIPEHYQLTLAEKITQDEAMQYVVDHQQGEKVMTWERLNQAETMVRLAEIDEMFEKATGWGSWMVSVANEREALVNSANKRWGSSLEHKWLARTASGAHTD